MGKYSITCFHHTDSILQIHYEPFRLPLFSGGKTPIIPEMSTCDDDAINNILKISQQNKVSVIFTHNHCLSKIARKMNGWRLKSDYLETLVLHRDNDNLILDGVLIPHNILH